MDFQIFTYKKNTFGVYQGDYREALIPKDYLLCITDPPYGVTDNEWDVKLDLQEFWNTLIPKSKQETIFTISCTAPFAFDLYNSNPNMWRQDLVWKKPRFSDFFECNRKPLRIHEYIYIFCRNSRYESTYNPQMKDGTHYKTVYKKTRNASANWSRVYRKEGMVVESDKRYPTTIIDDFPAPFPQLHPTQKPVELFEWLIKTYSNPDDLVIDPFLGSGTSAIASINSGRNFFGIEKDTKYFEMCCKRIEERITQLKNQYSLLLTEEEQNADTVTAN